MASEHEHVWTWAMGEHGTTERRCACGNEDWYAPASELMYSLKQMSQGKKEVEQQLAQVTAERDTLVADLRQRQAGQTSAEQQLAQARQENALLKDHTQDGYWGRYYRTLLDSAHETRDTLVEQRDTLRNENAAMRALLERFTGMLRESFRADGSLAGEGFNVSLTEQVRFCREVRAFLAEHPQEAGK